MESEEPTSQEYWAHPANKEKRRSQTNKDLILDSGRTQSDLGIADKIFKFILLLCVLGLPFCIKYMSDWHHFRDHATAVSGQVTGRQVVGTDRDNYTLDWSYQIDGETYVQQNNHISEEVYRSSEVGAEIALLVDKTLPDYSTLTEKTGLFDYSFLVLM